MASVSIQYRTNVENNYKMQCCHVHQIMKKKTPHPNGTELQTAHPLLSLQKAVRQDRADLSDKSVVVAIHTFKRFNVGTNLYKPKHLCS